MAKPMKMTKAEDYGVERLCARAIAELSGPTIKGEEAARRVADAVVNWLLKLARTNFAACYGAGSHCPYVYDDAVVALSDRFPPVDGNRDYITQVCRWLYEPAKEKCTCQAPLFITGCDNAVSKGEDSEDECTCTTGECPWTLHTGVFQ